MTDRAGQGRLIFDVDGTRDAAAEQFFQRTMGAAYTVAPRVIMVDKNAVYPKALIQLKAVGTVPIACELRQVKYLNNLIEQDCRFIKRLVSQD